MIIYRVEDKQGFGYKGHHPDPDYIGLDEFVTGCCLDWEYTSWGNEECRPVPWQDGIPKYFLKRDGWFFGFQSLEDVHRWFTPYDIFLMGHFGGMLVEYDIDENHVWKGNRQCVFYMNHARQIKKTPIGEFTSITEFGDWMEMEEYEDMLEKYQSIP